MKKTNLLLSLSGGSCTDALKHKLLAQPDIAKIGEIRPLAQTRFVSRLLPFLQLLLLLVFLAVAQVQVRDN